VADTVEISFGADVAGAVGSINQLKEAISGVAEPLEQIRALSAEAAVAQQSMIQRQIDETMRGIRTMEQVRGAYTEAFRNSMQVMVDERQITMQQALGFDLQHTAQMYDQLQEQLAFIRDFDQTSVDDREKAIATMAQLEARYTAAASRDYRSLADNARREADRVSQAYEQAFDRLGSSVQRTFNDIVTQQITWSKGMTRVVQDVETFFLSEIETIAAKWAASGLANLAGGAVAGAVTSAQATGATGLGAGLMALVGIGQPGGLFGSGLLAGSQATGLAAQAAVVSANTAALGAATTAMTALTAALGGATAAAGTSAGASLAGGGAAAAGAAASGGGGLFSWIGGLFGFARGGIVPSAAGGWVLPSFAGATPALLHAQEMVLPADISQGLQGMIAGRGGAADAHFHAHFHGPADAPAISRWFRENLRSNSGAVRDLFRQNALTPRSF
jgi:hypothetical protein